MAKTKSIAISQSNYVPWKGYFDLIASVDTFVLYDSVQYTRRDWRNRNKIKTVDGMKWLTIPVDVKGKYYQKIDETRTSDHSWRRKHWGSICQNYSKCSYFEFYEDIFRKLYLESTEEKLSDINFQFLIAICSILDINTEILRDSEFHLRDGQSDRLLGICEDLGADIYVSGPAAKEYLDEPLFNESNVTVKWFDYSNYPEYNQRFPPFEHGVTILDLIFNEGPNASKFMKNVKVL